MKATCSRFVVAVLGAIALSAGIASAGDVNISVGWPPPLIVEKPRVVVVPETQVYRAPNLDFNVFLFEGRYYSFHNDRWFMSVKIGAPWTPLVIERVPVAVREVPAQYYRRPPGIAKKMHRDDDTPGRGKGCPPGLAKQGRC